MGKIENLINNKGENYVFPFFWQHGEDESTLRKYMEVIDQANCRAVCVESRPHPDFCGPKWWRDMDIILDEARKRNMKVWILDDSHFPTGYANGAVKNMSGNLRRQSVYTKSISVKGKKKYRAHISRMVKRVPTTAMWKMIGSTMNKGADTFKDDCILDVAVKQSGMEKPKSISYKINRDVIEIELLEDVQTLYITFLTRNVGIHRDYMNMMSHDSCKLLLEYVYEPHYEHYKDDFGKTIAGFFSDEPELGNGVYFTNQVKIGNDFDMPWSMELEEGLQKELGEDWKAYLPLLYDDSFSDELVSKIRLIFMNHVTRLVEKNFSCQIGNWCQEHGVEYIGHIIEDNNQHCRTGASLGHYFRALSGQDMAGIDNIGGQVIPYGEDAPAEGLFKWLGGRDGEFYHYCLGALGASYAAIDPKKKGRCMCEIFGNYGWSEGPRMEKYLVDHFMVQGVNRFVPHAFSPKDYPDKDCPPHFYANGHNPQYRAFGKLMAYTNRVCSLISGGKAVCDVAVIYHGEHEWMGDAMLDQKVLRVLMENQIIAHIIPCDVFLERDRYHTQITEEGLFINENHYSKVLIPQTKNITDALASGIEELANTKTDVFFIENYPEYIIHDTGRTCVQHENEKRKEKIKDITKKVSLEKIIDCVDTEVRLAPKNHRIRYFHYLEEEEIIYLVNENDTPYEGILLLKKELELYRYDAWENKVYAVDAVAKNNSTKIKINLKPCESVIFVVGKSQTEKLIKKEKCIRRVLLDPEKTLFKISSCKAIDYPNFTHEERVTKLMPYSYRYPKFSGYIAYEFAFELDYEKIMKNKNSVELYIENAGEDVEVFVNGKSAGIQVFPPFYFDITNFLEQGENLFRIEVATTLERERGVNKKKQEATGVFGNIELFIYDESIRN